MRKYTELKTGEIRKILKGWDFLEAVFDRMSLFKDDLNKFLFTIEREKKRKFRPREIPRIVKSYAYGWDDGERLDPLFR